MIKDKNAFKKKVLYKQKNVVDYFNLFFVFFSFKELEEDKVPRRSRSKFHTFPLISSHVFYCFPVLLIEKIKVSFKTKTEQ